jgi:hypothetical protein
MGSKIWTIIFIIILAGVGLYLLTSGVITKGIESLGSFAHFSSTTSLFHFNNGSSTGNTGPAYTFLTPIGYGQPSIITTPTSNNNGNGSAIPSSEIPSGYTAAQLSPYFHQIRLASVSVGTSYYYGTIVLDAYFNNPSSTVDITGWQIKSRNSGEYIPQAIAVYDPSGLTSPSDIRLKNNDVVDLYSSSAPFNLRLNECVGYIAHVANFVPALPLSCPYVDQSKIQNLSGQCQNYIETINSCQAPNAQTAQISQNDYACQDFLNNNFTYKSCFNQHDTDANFLSNQVWVWMGSNVVDQYHDTVSLLDKSGLLVDQYTY